MNDESEKAETRAQKASNRLSAVPLLVWLIVLLQAALMVGAILIVPTFQEPDEIAHVDYVMAYRHGNWLYAPGERHYQSGVLAAFNDVPNTQFRLHVGGVAAIRRGDRRSFDEQGTALSLGGLPNQMVQHPPLFYATAALFSYVVPGFSHQHFDIQVFWLRIFSLLLMLPIPVLIFLAARQLTGDQIVALVAAVIPLSMPGYLRVGASVTNDSMAALFGAALLYALAKVATGDLSRRTAIFTGLLWAGGLLTKGFALTMAAFIVLAYLVGASGSLRGRVRSVWLPVVVCGAVGVAVGGWWWIRNVVVYGVVQPNGFGSLLGQRSALYGADRPGGTDLGYFKQFFYLVGQRMWGSLGLIDVPKMQDWKAVTIGIGFVVFAVIGVGIGLVQSRAPRTAAAVFLFPSLLIMGLLYTGSRQLFLHHPPLVAGVQSRYFAPVVGGLSICAAVGLRRLAGRFARWLPPAIAVGAVMFEVSAAIVILSRQMSPPSAAKEDLGRQVRDGLHFVGSWSPWSLVPTVALAGLSVLISAAVLAFFFIRAVPPTAFAAPRAPRHAAVPSAEGSLQATADRSLAEVTSRDVAADRPVGAEVGTDPRKP